MLFYNRPCDSVLTSITCIHLENVPALSSSRANEAVQMCLHQMSELSIFTSSPRGRVVISEIESWIDDEMRCEFVNAVNRSMQAKEPASRVQQLSADYGLSVACQNYLLQQLIKVLPKLSTTETSVPASSMHKSLLITDNDKQAIFYVGGSVLAFLLKNKAQDAEAVEFIHNLHVEQENCGTDYAEWTALQSNKALKFISKPFFDFLLKCEEAIITKIDSENGLRKNCFVRDMFINACLDSVSVGESWDKLSAGLTSNISERLLHIMLTKFCNTRSKGFTRYINQNVETIEKSSESLRQSLKRK